MGREYQLNCFVFRFVDINVEWPRQGSTVAARLGQLAAILIIEPYAVYRHVLYHIHFSIYYQWERPAADEVACI